MKKFKGTTTILETIVIDTYNNNSNVLITGDGEEYYATGPIYPDEYNDYLKWEKETDKEQEKQEE